MTNEFETKFREAQEPAAPRRKTSADQREWTSAQKRTSQEWRDPHNRANGNAWRDSEAALIVQCARGDRTRWPYSVVPAPNDGLGLVSALHDLACAVTSGGQ